MGTYVNNQTRLSCLARITRSVLRWTPSRRHLITAIEVLMKMETYLSGSDTVGKCYLIDAMLSNQTETVNASLCEDGGVKATRHKGLSDSEQGHTEGANMLLNNGAQVETRKNHGRNEKVKRRKPLCLLFCIFRRLMYFSLLHDAANGQIARKRTVFVAVYIASDYIIRRLSSSILWLAAERGHTDVVRALVSAGADVNTQSNDGSSALGFASYKGYIDIVNILLDNGAQIETRDNDKGRTPLWFAAANGRTHVVRALVSAGADVNTQSNDCLLYTSDAADE